MTVQKFRKKPVVVEAIQWDGPATPIIDWIDAGGGTSRHFPHSGPDIIFIEMLQGTVEVRRGDWIIRGVAGEFYPCKPEIFDATYEPVALVCNGWGLLNGGLVHDRHCPVHGGGGIS